MNEKMRDIMKLARIELIIIPVFIFFKYIRPGVLKKAPPEFVKITLHSLPNFFEALIGTLTLTGVILILNDYLKPNLRIRPKVIYVIATILAGVYVVAQEFNIIHVRANTTFDPNDVVFSMIGLIIGYLIVVLINPQIRSEVE